MNEWMNEWNGWMDRKIEVVDREMLNRQIDTNGLINGISINRWMN